MDARDLLEQEIPQVDLQDIVISDRARDRLLELGYNDVEFSTEGGGCSGMNYILRPIERDINERDKVIKNGDLNLDDIFLTGLLSPKQITFCQHNGLSNGSSGHVQ